MDTTTVYEPERPHECYPWPPSNEATQGTVIRCDVCGRFWQCRRQRFSDGFGGYPTHWGRVRLWHFRTLRKLRQASATDRPIITHTEGKP